MTERRPNTRPYCFGRLDTVFPMGADGLRATPESCMVCYCKTECLRQAMAGPDGDQVRRGTFATGRRRRDGRVF